MIQIHKSIPIETQDLGLWEGDIKTFIPENENPGLKWKGGVIPLNLMKECLAFFRYGWLEWKSECQVRLFYNAETKMWKAEAFPQWVSTGMTSREIDTEIFSADQKHKDQRAEILQALENTGYQSNGTAHSHGATGAFQSSTDYADEIKQPGLHLTFGKVTSPECEIHGRVSFRGIMYDVNFNDWVPCKEDPGDVNTLTWHVESLPLADKEALKAEFPVKWLDCCHIKVLPKWSPPTYNYRYGYGYNPHTPTTTTVGYNWNDKDDDEWDYAAGQWKEARAKTGTSFDPLSDPNNVIDNVVKNALDKSNTELADSIKGALKIKLQEIVQEEYSSEPIVDPEDSYYLQAEADELVYAIESAISELGEVYSNLFSQHVCFDEGALTELAELGSVFTDAEQEELNEVKE